MQNFILKGGFLIAAMVGLDARATMDMDATIKGLPVNEQTVREMFEEICKIELDDDVTFSSRSVGEIREGKEKNFSYPYKHVCYEHMSHMMLEYCGSEIKYFIKSERKYPEECAGERKEMGNECVEWIENVWE